MTPAERTHHLIAAGLAAAAATGWRTLTREQIAARAGVSPALVSARLGTADSIRRAVMRAAVRERCVPVVAQGLAARHPAALKADESLRAAAAEWVRAA